MRTLTELLAALYSQPVSFPGTGEDIDPVAYSAPAHDDFFDEDAGTLSISTLASTGASRLDELERFERVCKKTLPPSFKKVIAEIGYPDIKGNLTTGWSLGPVWLEWVGGDMGRERPPNYIVDKIMFGLEHGRRKIGALHIVDNPGDMPGSALVAIDGHAPAGGDALWGIVLYDSAMDSYTPFLPVAGDGAAFFRALILGVTDLMLVQDAQLDTFADAAARVGEAFAAEVAASLDALADVISFTRGLPFTASMFDPAADDEVSMDMPSLCDLLTKRLTRARAMYGA